MFWKKIRGEFNFLPVLLLIFVSGCATVDFSTVKQRFGRNNPPVILDVPFIKQERFYCGPAALCSVFRFWEYSADQEDIARAIYQPKLRGVLNIDLELYAKQQGFWAQSFKADFGELQHFLKNNIPVIVLEKLHPYILNRRHFVVIVGFDAQKNAVFEHDGQKPFVIRSYRGFLRNWDKGGDWMLVVVPPEKVDWDLSADANLELGMILEKKKSYALAAQRYEKASEQKPAQPIILFNLANIYAKMKQWEPAESRYLEAVKLNPDFSDAYNNLAYVYLERKQYDSAHIYVDKALSFGRQKLFYYLDTKAQIYFSEGKYDVAIDCFKQAEDKKQDIADEQLIAFYKDWTQKFRQINRTELVEVLAQKTKLLEKIN